MGKKSLLSIILSAVCLLMLCSGCAGKEKAILPETVEMYFFYDEICASCDLASKFDVIAADRMAPVRETYPYQIHKLNTFTDSGQEYFKRICAEMGLDSEAMQLPVLIVGGRTLQGLEAIDKEMAEAYLVAGEDIFVRGEVYNPSEKKTGAELFSGYPRKNNGVRLVYFYRITCDECNQVKPIIEALPESIEVDGKKYPVEVIPINTRSGNNSERVVAFFSDYAVPDEDRMVPIVFFAEGYLAGFENIEAGIEEKIRESAGKAFEWPKQKE